MEFVTEWQPLGPLKIRSDNLTRAGMGDPFRNYEMRHWVAVIGAALFILAPLAWLFSGVWASASLLASLGLLMISTATFLVPDSQAELDGYESSED
jgi:hypothetical protein